MKKGFLLLLSLVLFPPFVAGAADPPDEEITIYKDGGYSGSSSNMTGSNSSLVPIGWNDMISSIKLGKRIIKVVVYEHINYKGKSRTLKSDTSFSGNWWNDKISSFKIYVMPPAPPSNTVRFYWDKEYGGNTLDATADDMTLVDDGWNDKITSIMLGSSVEVKVFEHINCGSNGGKSKIIKENTDLAGTWWNDKISSFRVIQK